MYATTPADSEAAESATVVPSVTWSWRDKPPRSFVRRVTVAELYTIVAPASGVPSAARQRTRTLGGQVDDDRIRDFVDGEYSKVVATVALVCGSVATAEDSVQEALARAWERLDRGDGIDRLPAWVTTVALNLARSQMRRWRSERRARDRLGPLRDDLSDAPAASGDAHAVREALRALPRRQREVTVLRYYLGLDVREIADHLGIAEGTVKAMLFRARQSLAVTLGDDEEEVDRAHG
jgi:RNA polymerase sigma-70 factor (ECF subfamily)